jgi:hypothetical protein
MVTAGVDIVNIVRYRPRVVMLTPTTLRAADGRPKPPAPGTRREAIMHRIGFRIRTAAARLWTADRPLAALTAIMLAALTASLAGLLLDPRTITGAPAWLKPAKFAASAAIYAATLAWVFTYLPEWRQTRRIAGWTTAAVFFLEVAIVDLQAWRGTTSHFNVATLFDTILFGVMGAAIAVQTVAAGAVAVALWRQRFADAAIGWALRAGMTLTLVGAATGGLMTRPTGSQLVAARATHEVRVLGAHTVGAPDGGPGLPGTGWSREHGDVRVPHFVGLHAMQALALIAVVLRRRSRPAAAALLRVAAASYTALFAILLWQALGGESIAAPSAMTLGVMAGWLMITAAAAWAVVARRTPTVDPHAAVILG